MAETDMRLPCVFLYGVICAIFQIDFWNGLQYNKKHFPAEADSAD